MINAIWVFLVKNCYCMCFILWVQLVHSHNYAEKSLKKWSFSNRWHWKPERKRQPCHFMHFTGFLLKRDVNSKSFFLPTNALMDSHQLTLKNCYIKDLTVDLAGTMTICILFQRWIESLLGGIAFKRAVPELWNSIPSSLCKSKTVDIYKFGLKTFLFKRTFNLK